MNSSRNIQEVVASFQSVDSSATLLKSPATSLFKKKSKARWSSELKYKIHLKQKKMKGSFA